MSNTTNAKTGMTLAQIANDGKALGKLVNTTIASYKKVAVALHNTACATMFHVAQYGECHALNAFYNALRVNDQTALRVWLGTHATYVDLEAGKVKPWLTFTKGEFKMVKGTETHRKDMFTVGETIEGRTDLLMLKPFYEKNVQDKDAITLEALIQMLASAAEKVEKKSKDENISLPADILTLIPSIKNVAEKELKAIEFVKANAA